MRVRFHRQDPQCLLPKVSQGPVPASLWPLCELTAHLTLILTCLPAAWKVLLDNWVVEAACHSGLTSKCHLHNEALQDQPI